MNIFSDLQARLVDAAATCRELADAAGEIERAYKAGRVPVPGLIVARVLVGVDQIAADLARLADQLGNAADPGAGRDSFGDK